MYKLKDISMGGIPRWMEVYETRYDNQRITVEVQVPEVKSIDDYLRLKIHSEEGDFIGLGTYVDNASTASFFKSQEGGTTPMDLEESPNLEEFVARYKLVFESHRDLRETYKRLLE